MEYTIYKIYCKDENVKDCYVGSTKDFNRRKAVHKFDSKKKDLKLYKFMFDNGGFNNFNIEIIETLICENKNEALIRERFWIEELKASLNKCIPSRTKKEYREYWINSFDYSNHRKNSDKIYRENNKDKLNQEASEKCLCICGNYYTKRHKARHEKSKKHQDYLSPLPNGL
jgi:hypothetical protein